VCLLLEELRPLALPSQAFYTNIGTGPDFAQVGSPCGTNLKPAPSSRDPQNPGVLVLQLEVHLSVERPADAPILLVGTLDNAKATRGWQDGSGLAMYVQAKDGSCFTGQWAEWGIIRCGRGRFQLCKL